MVFGGNIFKQVRVTIYQKLFLLMFSFYQTSVFCSSDALFFLNFQRFNSFTADTASICNN